MLLAACLGLLSGCQTLLLTPQRDAAPEAENDTPYVRLAASWAAAPLAEDLLRAYGSAERQAAANLETCEGRLAEEMLATGEADLAIVERPLVQGSADRREITLALDALAIVVHPDSPLHRIAPQELAALYGGYVLDWSTLEAGPGEPELVSREEGAFARRLFEGAILKDATLSSAALILPHDEAVIGYVAAHPLAIGYASRVAVDERVKVISLNGLLPSANTIAQGRYPLTYRLVLLQRDAAGAASAPAASAPASSRLATFAVSARGQRAIAQRYVLP
jgi:phosphate transport system substrate-binding protein